MTGRTTHDVCIVGCGLIGLAVGRAIAEAHPGISIVMLEKENRVGTHQSSHNSGVVHSGLYYRPGSLKARLSVAGRESVYALCESWGVPHKRSGKVVIATHPSEVPALDELERRGRANGLSGLRRLNAGQIGEFEPHATGLDALHVPEAGVADFPELARLLASGLASVGAEIVTGREVTHINHGSNNVSVRTVDQEFNARLLVNCAGLHSDRLAAMAGIEPSVRIIPFRGEYYRLDDVAAGMVKSLIYPVPDPRFPFLGVHFTRRIDGMVEVGPNAVFALGREHYRGVKPDWSDVFESLSYPGFYRLAWKHWRSGTTELMQSRSRRLYAGLARRLVPSLERENLIRGGVGVRAQAVGRNGELIDDFVIETAGSTLHVLNAPSPGATACLALGRHIAGIATTILAG